MGVLTVEIKIDGGHASDDVLKYQLVSASYSAGSDFEGAGLRVMNPPFPLEVHKARWSHRLHPHPQFGDFRRCSVDRTLACGDAPCLCCKLPSVCRGECCPSSSVNHHGIDAVSSIPFDCCAPMVSQELVSPNVIQLFTQESGQFRPERDGWLYWPGKFGPNGPRGPYQMPWFTNPASAQNTSRDRFYLAGCYHCCDDWRLKVFPALLFSV